MTKKKLGHWVEFKTSSGRKIQFWVRDAPKEKNPSVKFKTSRGYVSFEGNKTAVEYQKEGAIRELTPLLNYLDALLLCSDRSNEEVPEYITAYEVREELFNRIKNRIKELEK